MPLFELSISIFGFFVEILIELSHFLVLLLKLGVGVLGEGVDVALQIISCLFNLELEFMLECEKGVVCSFRLVCYILLAALYFPSLWQRLPLDVLKACV